MALVSFLLVLRPSFRVEIEELIWEVLMVSIVYPYFLAFSQPCEQLWLLKVIQIVYFLWFKLLIIAQIK